VNKSSVIGLVILVAVGIVIVLIRAGEPRNHGRALTSWLQQYWDSSLEETQRLAEAKNAVRAIGERKALPKLLKLVEARDDPASLWMVDTGEKFRISDTFGDRFFRWRSAEDFWWLGERGFEIFGTNAAPAADELGKLFIEQFSDGEKQYQHTLVIERCLESIGKPAELVICRTLTNSDPEIRQWAIDQLASVSDDVAVYIARIKPFLKDSSNGVRRTTVDAIGTQTSAPELAVPILIGVLNDSSVNANAATALANFGTNALVTFPILTNLVEHGDTNVAGAALKTLIIIAPDESLTILTNCIARGRPETYGALEALKNAAPEKALPIILERFHAPNLDERLFAFRLLCRYPMTPTIESTIQTAAADPEFEIARRAKEILTEQYEKEHPIESLFANDPSYGGKPLGEWLKLHDRDGFFSQDATNAIRRIGTNAIPALFQRLTHAQPPFGLPTRENGEIRMDGVRGFIALGDETIPAFPKLEMLMDGTSRDVALCAMVSSLGAGSNSIPILAKGLTNQFADVRSEAAHNLTGVAERFPECRKEIVPLLQKLLDDPDAEVRESVKGDLQELNSTNAIKTGTK
jgi:HEAT repeat protein